MNDPKQNKTTPKTKENRPSRAPNTTEKPKKNTPEMIKKAKLRAAQKKMILNNLKRVSAIMLVVIVISVSIAYVTISCVNDFLAIHVNEEKNPSVSVVITEGMDTDSVIDTLKDAGVIKNAWFCKFVARFVGYSDEGYIPRTYELRRSMGLEGILNEIKNNSSSASKTATITFPEGYTADQIFALLEENNVCKREDLISVMKTTDFSKEFRFLESITNAQSRYMLLEGFLFPDTYDFYIGESPESVIKKFLNNFNKKWTDSYAEKADQLGMTVDQVVNLASIVEKEATGDDMPVVGSILINRMDANMRLDCDSTKDYIDSNLSGLSETTVEAYKDIYDTYRFSLLPVGPICNPGKDALSAVLNAPQTEYYYFIHDANNQFRVAKSLTEHENNISTYGVAQLY